MSGDADHAQGEPSSLETISKIQQIILNELDTEIFLKTSQLHQIKQEIQKGEKMLACLRQKAFKPAITSACPNSPQKNGQNFVFDWTVSGECVKLRCPECHKDAFLNMLGFTNHCRIVHGIVFMTPEDRIQRCGVPVELIELPVASSANGKSVEHEFNKSLAQLRIELSRNLPDQKPTIAVANEIPVDMSIKSVPSKRRASSCENGMDLLPCMNGFHYDTHIPLETTEQKETADQGDSQSSTSRQTPASNDDGGKATDAAELEFVANPLSHLYSTQTRFYLKKRIVVGNLVKSFYDENEKKHCYRWRLYIRDPDANSNVLSKFVKRVRYHLHSSYAPENQIESDEYPFLLTRTGWGEFVVRIELDVENKKLPVELFFPLKLKAGAFSMRYVLGNEQSYELEIDRNSSHSSYEHLELTLVTEHSKSPSSREGERREEFRVAQECQKNSRYCKYCGMYFCLQKSFESHSKVCELKLEDEHINSFSPFPALNFRDKSSVKLNEPAIINNGHSSEHDANVFAIDSVQHIPNSFTLFAHQVASDMQPWQHPLETDATHLLGKAVEKFTKDLVQRAISNLRDNSGILTGTKGEKTANMEKSGQKRILTPVHFYNAIIGDEKMDFLTNKHLLKT